VVVLLIGVVLLVLTVVIAITDGIVGEILFWVLRHVLGTSVYVQSVHFIWVKIYSRMLTTIVPVAIALELKGGSESSKERSSYRSAFMFDNSTQHQLSVQSQAEPDDDDNDSLVSEKIRQAEPTQSAKSVAKSMNSKSGYIFENL